MIHQINHIKNLGIFQNYVKCDQLSDFNRYNLIYGWNGSGKSTLSTLFECIERRKNCTDHSDAEWEIVTGESKITEKNIDSATNNVHVFNKSFVERNIFTPDEKVEGIKIVYISEDQKKDKETLDEKKEELKKKSDLNVELYKKLYGDQKVKSKGLKNEIDTFLTNAAKSIKSEFQYIQVEDKRLINYNKVKLLEFINDNEKAVKSKTNILTIDEIETLRKSIKPQNKNLIDTDQINEKNIVILPTVYNRIVELLSSVVTNKVITHLKENPEISKWVYEGLQTNIHPDGATKCEFCGNDLSKDRIKELNDHFSTHFIELKENLINEIVWIKENHIMNDFPLSNLLYDEFQNIYIDAINNFNNAANTINTILSEWESALQKKLENPFVIPEKKISSVSQDLISAYYSGFKNLCKIINEHNSKFNSLEEIVHQNKKTIELHYVSIETSKYDYFQKKKQESSLLKELNNIGEEINTLEKEIFILENKLSNEQIGAEQFNEKLHKFLGRRDLFLEHRVDGGYIIKRNGSKSATSRSLSEGERSAIALVYFVIKLQENENNIKDLIIVFDDPISSFDSNHLFAARSFIQNTCENAKQLFILTHNFWFFKLIRDWFKRTKKGYALYQISIKYMDLRRIPEILNAGKDLIEYDSEYHYLFTKLKEFDLKGTLSIDESYICANIIRRICEASLSFKFPHLRSICQLIYATKIDKEKKDRIYDYLNKYSHLDRIETIENTIECRADEGRNIVSDVIDMLKEEMPTHYENMCRTIGN